jgi:hypothetical protein
MERVRSIIRAGLSAPVRVVVEFHKHHGQSRETFHQAIDKLVEEDPWLNGMNDPKERNDYLQKLYNSSIKLQVDELEGRLKSARIATGNGVMSVILETPKKIMEAPKNIEQAGKIISIGASVGWITSWLPFWSTSPATVAIATAAGMAGGIFLGVYAARQKHRDDQNTAFKSAGGAAYFYHMRKELRKELMPVATGKEFEQIARCGRAIRRRRRATG